MLLALAVACGDDSSSGGAGDSGMGDGDAAGDGDGSPDSGMGDGDGDGVVPVECEYEMQDNDGDGVCAPACSGATDCGFGNCVDASGEVACLCQAGAIGDACDTCDEGYEGSTCSVCSDGYLASQVSERACVADPCLPVECGNAGSCEVQHDVAVCVCNTGFAGASCNTCAAGYEGIACDVCATDYSPGDGGECIPDVCVNTDCGQGTCEFEPPSTAVCTCDEGWDGDACDVCEIGYLRKDAACVLELPVKGAALSIWLDMMAPGTYQADAQDKVYIWQSSRTGGPTQNATVGVAANAPTLGQARGLTFLEFDGDDHLAMTKAPISGDEYSMFIAMRPDINGPATMTPLAAVGNGNGAHHGLLVRSQESGTEVRYLHRSPLGLGGGDNVVSGTVTASTGFAPYQVVTAEHRTVGNSLTHLLRVDATEQFASAQAPGFDMDALDLLVGRQSLTGTDSPFVGRIGEVIVFDGVITESERAEVEAYLTKKWQPRRLIVQL